MSDLIKLASLIRSGDVRKAIAFILRTWGLSLADLLDGPAVFSSAAGYATSLEVLADEIEAANREIQGQDQTTVGASGGKALFLIIRVLKILISGI